MLKTYEFNNQSCKAFFDSFSLTERSDNLKLTIVEFCKNPNLNNAKQVYNEFLYTFRIPGLDEIIEVMKKFETASSGLIPKQRDHYVHTVNVFILGLSVYMNNKNVRRIIKNSFSYPDMYPTIEEEFLYRWGITSLFHDVGYPLEIAYKTIKEFTSILISPNLFLENEDVVKSNEGRATLDAVAILEFPNLNDILYINILRPLEDSKVKYYEKYPDFRNDLPNNLLLAIARNVSNKFGFATEEIIYNKLLGSLKNGLKKGLFDHGIYSSIILLKWLNEAFLKAEWNPAYYYIPVIDSATAILLHNAYEYIFLEPPFNLGTLKIDKHPLTFLLMLCDKIQETDRVSYGYEKINIKFESGSMYINDDEFYIKLLISPKENKSTAESTIDNINSSIHKSLDVNSVFKEFMLDYDTINSNASGEKKL